MIDEGLIEEAREEIRKSCLRKEVQKQIFCVLHTSIQCNAMGFERQCRIGLNSPFATCVYQFTAVVPAQMALGEDVSTGKERSEG